MNDNVLSFLNEIKNINKKIDIDVINLETRYNKYLSDIDTNLNNNYQVYFKNYNNLNNKLKNLDINNFLHYEINKKIHKARKYNLVNVYDKLDRIVDNLMKKINIKNYYFYYKFLSYGSNIQIKEITNLYIIEYLFYKYVKNNDNLEYDKINIILKSDYSYYLNFINKKIKILNNLVYNDVLSNFLENKINQEEKIKNQIQIINKNINSNLKKLNSYALIKEEVKLNNLEYLKKKVEAEYLEIKFSEDYNLYNLLNIELKNIQNTIIQLKNKQSLFNLKIKNKLNLIEKLSNKISKNTIQKKKKTIRLLNLNDKNHLYKLKTNLEKLKYIDYSYIDKLDLIINDLDKKRNEMTHVKRNNLKRLKILDKNLEIIRKKILDKKLQKKYNLLKEKNSKNKLEIIKKNEELIVNMNILNLDLFSFKKEKKNKKFELSKHNNSLDLIVKKIKKQIFSIQTDIFVRNKYYESVDKIKYNKDEIEEEVNIINMFNLNLHEIYEELQMEYQKKKIIINKLKTKHNFLFLQENKLNNIENIIININDDLNKINGFSGRNNNIESYIKNDLDNYYLERESLFKKHIIENSKIILNNSDNDFIIDLNKFLLEFMSNIFYMNNIVNINYHIGKVNNIIDYDFKTEFNYLKTKVKNFSESINKDIELQLNEKKDEFINSISKNIKNRNNILNNIKNINKYNKRKNLYKNRLDIIITYIKKYN